MKQIRRVDKNQKRIVEALRRAGASVLHTHILGKGAPDIVVGYQGKNYLFEIKDGSAPPSARMLTVDEQDFHALWRGQISVIDSVDAALRFLQCVRC